MLATIAYCTMYVYMHVCMCLCVDVYACMYVYVHVCMYLCVYEERKEGNVLFNDVLNTFYLR